jgi:steroid 5-alpha reductase family enzyme
VHSTCRYPRLGKKASLAMVGLVYLAAVVMGLEVAGLWPALHPVMFVLVADLAATIVVFAFSAWYRNASVYDPYWSIIPILIELHWALGTEGQAAVPLRQVLVIALVAAWGLRLTWNWILRWHGLGDEDWRYTQLRVRHGSRFWLVNLFGIHLMPTLLVFGGCLATWPALAASNKDLNGIDAIALLLAGAAIWIEWRADRELRAHRSSNQQAPLHSGLWARCRHPNYLGEIGFWWGLYLFALAANPLWWWTVVGPLLITLLFIFVSIPMMDNRLLEKNPGYAQTVHELPALWPWHIGNTQRNP